MPNSIIELILYVQVRTDAQNPYSYDAYCEAYETVRKLLEKDPRIRQVGTDGIRNVEEEHGQD